MIRNHYQALVVDDSGVHNTHSPSTCRDDEACCIHKPSRHPLATRPLRAIPQVLAAGRFVVMLRLCRHGRHHIDPDCRSYLASVGLVLFSGCDSHRCCCNCDQDRGLGAIEDKYEISKMKMHDMTSALERLDMMLDVQLGPSDMDLIR